jgi:hypothetical protein
MKKQFLFVGCIVLGCLLMFELADPFQCLPGTTATSDVGVVIAGLQGQCQLNAGTPCKGAEGQVASTLCSIGDTTWVGFCLGACQNSKHDILDSSESGEATMSPDGCCRSPYYCAGVYGASGLLIGGTPVSPSTAGITCPLLNTRNKCSQN